MKRAYTKRGTITFSRIITAFTTKLRFDELYLRLCKFCKQVSVRYIKAKGSNVKFELSVVY